MNADLRGKTAVITGADEGFGSAVARHFAALGCCLVLTGRCDRKLQSLKVDCLEEGLQPSQVIIMRCDIQQESEVEAAFAKAARQLGAFHVLVNSPGTVDYGNISEITPSVLQDVMNAHVLSVVVATKAAASYLEETKGAVINISCCTSLRTSPGLLAFNMAMSAVNTFTQHTALELSRKKIRVNAVSPSIRVYEDLMERPPALQFQDIRKAPLDHKEPTISDVVKTVAFLASDESAFISGENICVDNGLHAAGVPF